MMAREIAWARTRKIGELATPIVTRNFPRAKFLSRYWFPIILSATVSALVYKLLLNRGHFGDEGSYCTVAQGIIRGGLPYRDYFNEKPPLQYFLTASIMAVARADFASARILPAISLGLSLSCVLLAASATIAKRIVLTGWAVLAVLLAIIFSGYSNTAESTLAVIYAASMLIITSDLHVRRPIVMATALGWLFGAACGFRQAAFLPGLILLLAPELTGVRRYFALGFVAGVLSWVAPIFRLGIGPEFVNSTILFHLNNPGASKYARGLEAAGAPGLLLWLACLGFVAAVRQSSFRKIWLICWLLAMAAPFFGRMDAFRLWPSIAAMLVFLAARPAREGRWAGLAPIATGAMAFGMLMFFHPARAIEDTEMARFISSRTGARERIWVAPYYPLYYCLSSRIPASRYYFILPWTNKDGVKRTIISDVTNSSPTIIVAGRELHSTFPEIESYIVKNYRRLKRKYGPAVYERNGRR